jgi:hypothetical protein
MIKKKEKKNKRMNRGREGKRGWNWKGRGLV